jgi:hypothetical protein
MMKLFFNKKNRSLKIEKKKRKKKVRLFESRKPGLIF